MRVASVWLRWQPDGMCCQVGRRGRFGGRNGLTGVHLDVEELQVGWVRAWALLEVRNGTRAFSQSSFLLPSPSPHHSFPPPPLPLPSPHPLPSSGRCGGGHGNERGIMAARQRTRCGGRPPTPATPTLPAPHPEIASPRDAAALWCTKGPEGRYRAVGFSCYSQLFPVWQGVWRVNKCNC